MDLGIGGKRAAVAAASRGLGFAAAEALAREGVRVAIGARDEGRLAAAAEAIEGDAVAVPCDVSTPEGAARFVEDAAARLGGLDILVPNSGAPPSGTFTSTGVSAYAPALSLNLLSVVAMCKAAVPAMQARGWGRVVAITSIAVRQPIPGLILSNTSRAGVTGFLKTLALEVAGDGVTVNSVLPAYHATERLREVHGDDLSHLAAELPAGKVGQPRDLGAVVAFLCSQSAGFITGTTVPLDGGWNQGLP